MAVIILLHSSKTMRSPKPGHAASVPMLLNQAEELADYIKTLSSDQLANAMHISPALATKTQQTYKNWTTDPHQQSLAIDSFVGDIYSGLRADDLDQADRQYAQKHLAILSGLYGLIRPLDGIMPYRLEMAYKFYKPPFDNLYLYWGSRINDLLPTDQLIVNTSSVEYSQVITKFRPKDIVITPQFFTNDSKTKQPAQVVVHSKIARGAFARWLIKAQIVDPSKFNQFTDLNYRFDAKLSTDLAPTFVCDTFGGIGLSQRLK